MLKKKRENHSEAAFKNDSIIAVIFFGALACALKKFQPDAPFYAYVGIGMLILFGLAFITGKRHDKNLQDAKVSTAEKSNVL